MTVADRPLEVAALVNHVTQCIQERMNLGHLYTIEDGEACATDEAAASIWRVVYLSIREGGWRLVKDTSHE